MDSPCRNCVKRKVGCHSDCKEYLEYKEIIETRREAERLRNLKPHYKKPVPGDAYRKRWKKKIKEE